jgi:hypothetical protein
MLVGLFVGVFLITAFAFAENGGQIQPVASVSAALPETPAKAPAAAPAPAAKKPLGITYGLENRLRIDAFNNMADVTNGANDENRFMRDRIRGFVNVPLGQNVDFFAKVGIEPFKRWYTTCPAYNAATKAGGCSQNDATRVNKSISTPWMAGDFWVDNAYLDFKKLP